MFDNQFIDNLRNFFSKGISFICEAPLLAIPVFFILNLFFESKNFLLIETVCLFFATILPVATALVWGKIKGIDKDYTDKKTRNLPFLLVSFIYFIGTYILWALSANPLTISLMFCYTTNTFIVFLINLKWKISVHAMGVAGPTTALMFLSTSFGFLLGLLGPLVMWSRLYQKKHTISQVLVGNILGYILTAFQMFYLTKMMGFNIIDISIIAWTIMGLIAPPIVLSLTGYLNDKGVPDGYTRKIFHSMAFGSFFVFLSFSSFFPTIALVLSGTVSILIACFGGLNFSWLRGMRRKSDSPNETFYVILPLISSLLWIVLGTLFFSKTILLIGTACVAICDALAEPIGVKFGKHKYNVKAIKGEPSQRSIEGSMSIFVSALIVLFLLTHNIFLSVITSLILTLVESISPRGTDNVTIPLSVVFILILSSFLV